MLVKPENLRGAANICSDSGKRPLAAMFGADETLQGGGLAIYCLFYNAEKRDIDVLKALFPADGPLEYLPGMSASCTICSASSRRDIPICVRWCCMKAFPKAFIRC
mgnify:CR=1 FL=1